MKIRKAQHYEKQHYSGLHPLFGYVTMSSVLGGVRTRHTVVIEYLGEGRDEPNYEAILPDGFHLALEGIHTVLGVTQKDLKTRLSAGLEECAPDCSCKETE